MNRSTKIAVSLSALSTLAVASRAHAQTISWKNSASGSWSLAGNWDPENVPDADTELAVISAPGTYSVDLDIAVSIGNLTIDNPGAALNILGATSLATKNKLTNTGLIAINPARSPASASLSTGAGILALTGSGTVRLSANPLDPASATLIANGGAILNNPGHTISGNGQLAGQIVNKGLIDANAQGLPLVLLNSTWANSGTIRATNGGILEISNTITQTAPGIITADSALVGFKGSPRINNGNLSTIRGGTMRCTNAQVWFASVTTDGTLEVVEATTLTLSGTTYTHNGNLLINNATPPLCTLTSSGAVTLAGDLTIDLNSPEGTTTGAKITGQFVIGPTVTIRGSGEISGPITNQGTIETSGPAGRIIISTATLPNQGTLLATDGAVLALESPMINQPDAHILANNAQVIFRGTIHGGSLDATNAGKISIKPSNTAATLDGVTSSGPIEIPSTSALSISSNGLNHNGSILVNTTAETQPARLSFNSGSDIGSGPIILNAPANSLASAFLTAPTGTPFDHSVGRSIVGNGSIGGAHRFRGTISPGTHSNPVGTFMCAGAAIYLTSSSVYHVDIESTTTFDKLKSVNTFAMAGTLELNPLPSYTPALGDSIPLIINSHPSGNFDRITAPPLPNPAWRWRVRYGLEAVTALVTCAADFDANAFVNADDFDQFAQAFTNADPTADFNNDGFVTSEDFDAFTQAFQSGC